MYFISNSIDLLKNYQTKISIPYSKLVNSLKISDVAKKQLLLKSSHPYAHFMIRRIIDDKISTKKILKMLKKIDSITYDQIKKINSEEIIVSQKQWLVSDEETRGAELIVNTKIDEETAQATLNKHILISTEAINFNWVDFIKPIKTITYIDVPGFDSIPFFSGSNSRLFGAISLSIQSKPWITAEVITHESAHHWLFLYEDQYPNMEEGWNDNYLYSPWREDPRPTMGLLHGIYVFTNISYVLYKFYSNSNIEDELKDGLIERISLITMQVKCASSEILNSKTITDEGLAICDNSLKLIKEIVCHLPKKEKLIYEEKVQQTRLNRIKKWNR